MKLIPLGKVACAQDAAIYGDYFFNLGTYGDCQIYSLNSINNANGKEVAPLATFSFEKVGGVPPHSNAACFSKTFYHPDDEFPLLYTNIYNNAGLDNKELLGCACVYRISRDANNFTLKLVQLIKIGFTENASLWCSEGGDVRPYGNFLVENDKFYAYNTKDGDNLTRYFTFVLPSIDDGEFDAKYGIKRVVLTEKDIIDCFDVDYHRYLQGGCAKSNKIYSLEGFSQSIEAPPALRIINLNEKCQETVVLFEELGTDIEPEMIDFSENGDCYYADASGSVYKLIF